MSAVMLHNATREGTCNYFEICDYYSVKIEYVASRAKAAGG